jgi:hypothetical protein
MRRELALHMSTGPSRAALATSHSCALGSQATRATEAARVRWAALALVIAAKIRLASCHYRLAFAERAQGAGYVALWSRSPDR